MSLIGSSTIIGDAVPNIPWEDKPKGCNGVVWRYSQNPVIPRNAIPSSNSIMNSAVVPYKGKFVGVFRCDDMRRYCDLHFGKSEDGINWQINHEPIKFQSCDPAVKTLLGYDPRVTKIDDRYYIVWCNSYKGPTIGAGWTDDFETYHQLENPTLPFNRNGVFFPKKINGNYAMLSRPCGDGHTTYGNIYYSESPDLVYWGKHRFVMGTTAGWQSRKIGTGPVPIETKEGWLIIYHGVLISCNGFVYSAGAALLDLHEPWKVKHRTVSYIMSPQELYECVGDTPNVVFPVATVADAPTGRIAIYYGAADTVIGLAFCQIDELIAYIKDNPETISDNPDIWLSE